MIFGPFVGVPEGLLGELVESTMTPGETKDLMLAINQVIIEQAMGAEMIMSVRTPSRD